MNGWFKSALVFVLVVLPLVLGCDCNQTALSCSNLAFASGTLELFQDCVSYPLCATAFYQTPVQDFALFQSLVTQVSPGFNADEAITRLLCEPCSAEELQRRAVTFYLSFLVQSVRCAPGEIPIFSSNSGTFNCQCSPEHDCHTQNVSVFALVVVLISSALIVVAYTINQAKSSPEKID